MKKVNIYDAKARLSEYLDLAQKGERIVICRRNQPVAEIVPTAAARVEPRVLGGLALDVPAAFFEPLPDDVVSDFDVAERTPAVAERGTPYAVSRPKARGKGAKR